MEEKKRTGSTIVENVCIVKVKDLAMAAYLKLQGYNFTGKSKEGKGFCFLVKESEVETFETQKVEYINGPFYKFDSELMALKSL